MNQKGEVTTTQIVGLVLLLFGFAIIILFLVSYPWKSGIDKEACHEQIVMRSSVNLKGLNVGTKSIIPLDKCGTEKICLSMSGGDCEEFGPATSEDRITKISVKNENDVMIVFANSLYDCNSLLGKGQLDFLPKGFSEKKYCLSCARIAFDKEAKEKLKDINYYDLYKLMYSMKDTDGNRFLEVVYPGFSSYEYSLDLYKKYQEERKTQGKTVELKDWVINIKQPGGFILLSSMDKTGTALQWLAGGAAAGTTFVALSAIAIMTGVGAPIGFGMLAVSGVAGGAAFYYTTPNTDYYYFAPFIVPYDLKSLSDIKCTNFQWA
ncbi:MAG: hypothetical protein ABH840_01035 [Nanoarchaeota archaeon]